MNRQAVLLGAILIVALTTLKASAQTEIFWQGGAGSLTDANYSDGTNSNLSPIDTDHVFIGNDGDVGFSNDSVGLGRLLVGHNSATLPGQGTLTVGSAAFVELTGGDAGAANAGLTIGNSQDGVVNIQDDAFVSVNRLVVVGNGNSASQTGTLNVTNGGILSVIDGNINLGDGIMEDEGVQGTLNISGSTSSITIVGGGADLVLAPRAASATYTQTDGFVSITDLIQVGTPAGSSTDSSFSISGGTLTTGTGTGANNGNFFVGRGAAVNPIVNISGNAVVNVGNRYLMGGTKAAGNDAPGFASGVTTNHSGGTLNVDLDIRVADAFDSETSDATYNLSGTGVINTNVSAGTVGGTVIGRRGIGRFFQTGGTANFNSPLVVANREAANAIAANGLYEINAGDLNVNAPTPTFALALNIAPNGTGEFRVVGDDATIDVTGDFAISSTENGSGTLAFELEDGELLSQINIVGAATFNAGANVHLDTSAVAPTQSSYDLLTATSIFDNGISFSGPAGWGYQIIPGGNGQILQIAEGLAPDLVGDYNDDGSVDAADYVVWRKNPGAFGGEQGYTDWRANFGETSSGAGGRGNAVGPVPEPAAAALLLIGLLGIGFTRDRVS
jgi:hypothetical protein